MELTWQLQVEIFECRYPRYSKGDRSPGRYGYAGGFELPNQRQSAVYTKGHDGMVWIEIYDPLPQGRTDRN